MSDLKLSPSSFYLVTVCNCRSRNRQSVIEHLSDLIGERIVPFCSRLCDNSLTFFVDDYQIAQKLVSLNRKIFGSGPKYAIYAKAGVPFFKMDDALVVVLRRALCSRCDLKMKEADLSRFQSDREFVEKELVCSLALETVLYHVTDVLMSLLPDLEKLIIDGNHLFSLREAEVALRRFRSLKVLSLRGNRIASVGTLNALAWMELVELDLRGNSIVESYRYRENYIRDVRRVLPSLVVLDGQALPQPICFDIDRSELAGSLPVWLPCHVTDTWKEFVADFIPTFYGYYDQSGRLELAKPYHPQASMSLTYYDAPTTETPKSASRSYKPYNRNMMLPGMSKPSNSVGVLFVGPSRIVDCFRKLPNTLHFLNGFSVDLVNNVTTPNLIQINVSGMFRELKPDASQSFKSFHRCFLLIKTELGFKIINDMLHIRYPSFAQVLTLKIHNHKEYKLLSSKLSMVESLTKVQL